MTAVIAFGIDALEPALLERLVEQGRLPAIADLGTRGRMMAVSAPAEIGSGAVWPTFTTGLPPAVHGIHGPWMWSPATMGFRGLACEHLNPFWKGFAEQGGRALVLDIPFAPVVHHPNLVEIFDWGAHDALGGNTELSPPSIEPLVREVSEHPLMSTVIDATGRNDHEGLERVGRLCVEGARLRGELALRLLERDQPDLTIVNFPEMHRAGHFLWHLLGTSGEDRLISVLEEIDRQIGRILESIEATPVLFSLHGMKPTCGIPWILPALLEEMGYATPEPPARRSWKDHLATAAIQVKKRVPSRLKKLYYRSVPRAVTQRLAQPFDPLILDWSRTRAFSMPSDQHGWIRLNVQGRERDGIVSAEEFAPLRDEIRARLLELRTQGGRPVVEEILFTADTPGDASFLLPDLVVHWTDAAEASPLKLDAWSSEVMPRGTKFSAQHALYGFCIAPPGMQTGDEPVRAEELGSILCAMIDGRPKI